MRILAFETSAKAASVALLEDDTLLGELYLNCGLTHSRTLLESAQRLLEITELTAKDIDAVACAAGPGRASPGWKTAGGNSTPSHPWTTRPYTPRRCAATSPGRPN